MSRVGVYGARIVRYIEFEKIAETVESLCISAGYELPSDVLAALEEAAQKESNPAAAKILNQLIENARIAKQERVPLCQDTGLAVVFVQQGAEVAVKPVAGQKRATSNVRSCDSRGKLVDADAGTGALFDAINAGVAAGFQKGYLRKSVVTDPLRRNLSDDSQDSKFPPSAGYTPAIIHQQIVAGRQLKLTVMTKGGGCENKSRFTCLRPTSETDQIIDWIVDVVRAAGADACPPFVVGVGIGGNFEMSCLLSKMALCRRLDQRNSDKFYAELEMELLSRINAIGLGPQGLGGDTTALAVLVETAPCHIASLPVAVNIECHSHRHKTAVI
jgi:fumarate hydratase subunit alpha